MDSRCRHMTANQDGVCYSQWMSSADDIHMRSAIDLGRRLREARKTQGFTQQELAEAVGISRQHLVDIEAGKTTERLSQLFELLALLGLELSVGTRHPGRTIFP